MLTEHCGECKEISTQRDWAYLSVLGIAASSLGTLCIIWYDNCCLTLLFDMHLIIYFPIAFVPSSVHNIPLVAGLTRLSLLDTR